ncbi:MAG: hypothetical protein JKY42_08015 [Flavobacteriales bacterium]|nr:hypothetical protein [Flavobacteriales bacterium]
MIKSVSILFVSVVILAESIGISVYKSVCRHSGEQTTSYFIALCCCAGDDGVSDCCDRSSEFVQLDAEMVTSFLVDHQIGIQECFFATPVVQNWFQEVKEYAEALVIIPPPPLITRDIRIFVQSFLI